MRLAGIALALAGLSTTAHAQAGLSERVYGASVEAGVSEAEARYARLVGGVGDGTEAIVLEASHGVSDRLSIGLVAEFEREPGETLELEGTGVEAVLELGRIEALGVDVAVYGEYEAVRGHADAIETKLLLQRRRGPFDGRLNLIVEKAFEDEPLELGYAALADWSVLGEARLGLQAFGDLGRSDALLARGEHFLGPVGRIELDGLPGAGELQVELGYLVALGEAKGRTDGQLRLLFDYEFRF